MHETTTEDILQAQKDEKVMSNIIEKNSGLIWSIVKRFTNRGYQTEELYQIGAIGFIKAIKRFNTDFDVKISTYAIPYIMGEIKRFIRDDGPIKVSRSIKELSMKVLNIQNEYLKSTGEEIKICKIAEILDVPKEEIAVALDSIKPLESINEVAYKEDSDGESKISKIPCQKDETNVIIDTICLKELIEQLEKREKQIILLRYYKQKTQTEVAKILGITQVQVSRLEKRILLTMRNNM